MSKKSLIALMTAAMQPDFSHSDLGTDSGMLDASPPQERGSRRETRSQKKASQITAFFRWLGGLVSNPATGKISHTKLWANVAAAAMTWKFVQAADAPEWL